MYIAICDDNPVFVKDALAKLKKLLPADTRYAAFESGDELLGATEQFDYIFLDIEMPGRDGIAVKDALESSYRNTKIVFLTNYIDRMQEAFGAGVIGFLSKPVEENKLQQIVNKILVMSQPKYVEFELGSKRMVVSFDDIHYIEAEDKYTNVFTRTGDRFCIRKTMKEWEEELPKVYFCRINRSVIVHYDLLQTSFLKVKLPSGKQVEVSRSQREKVKKGYTDYLLNKL